MSTPRKRQGQGRRNNKRPQKRSKKADPQLFWGSQPKLPEFNPQIKVTSEPSALVNSLGRPPLTGHETIAEHYFEAVYERAVVLAGALGTAGDLLAKEQE